MPRHDHERRLDLLGPLEDDLERLSHQNLGRDGHAGKLPRHHPGPLQVRLAELEEPLVDDVVVELLLLLELEDFRRLDREDVLDVVEDDVVILDVEGAADVERATEFLCQLERRSHGLEAVG